MDLRIVTVKVLNSYEACFLWNETGIIGISEIEDIAGMDPVTGGEASQLFNETLMV